MIALFFLFISIFGLLGLLILVIRRFFESYTDLIRMNQSMPLPDRERKFPFAPNVIEEVRMRERNMGFSELSARSNESLLLNQADRLLVETLQQYLKSVLKIFRSY